MFNDDRVLSASVSLRTHKLNLDGFDFNGTFAIEMRQTLDFRITEMCFNLWYDDYGNNYHIHSFDANRELNSVKDPVIFC